MRLIWSAIFVVLLVGGVAQAQDAVPETHYRLLLGGGYGAPTQWSGNVGLKWWHDRVGQHSEGMLVETAVGQSGLKVSGGLFRSAEDMWGDVRGVVVRTWADPVWATPDSTYVGAELGMT
jgi:hypothetical protein